MKFFIKFKDNTQDEIEIRGFDETDKILVTFKDVDTEEEVTMEFSPELMDELIMYLEIAKHITSKAD